MRHRPDTGTDGPESEERTEASGATEEGKEGKEGGRRIDLSMAQVSGSALAAVVAAKLASTLGVYGTILGAGMISVIATCGGPLFQHLFRRTGEQMRDVTVAVKPKARQTPGPIAPRGDRTLVLGTVHTSPPYDEEFGTATTHGTRMRGWKRPALAATLVFGVTMGGITAYELVAGQDFSGRQGTTTFGSAVRGGGAQDAPAGNTGPTTTPSGAPDGSGSGSGTPPTGSTPTPGNGRTGDDGSAAPSSEPTPSGSTGGPTPTPTPTPTPSGPTVGPTTDPTAPAVPSGGPTTGPDRPELPRTPAGGGTEPGGETGTGGG